MNKIFIYCLKDNENNIKYIGKSTNIKRRLSGHISEALLHKGRRPVLVWIHELLTKGFKPIIEIIEECTESNWEEREKFWILQYKNSILNLASGGLGSDNPKNYTPEELSKRSKTMIQTMSKYSEEDKTNIWKLIQEGKTYNEIKTIYPGQEQ